MKALRLVIFLVIAFCFITVVFACAKPPETFVKVDVPPPQPVPQPQCVEVVVTGIGRCVHHSQCPPPNYFCEVGLSNGTVNYLCNPVSGQVVKACPK